MNANIIQAREYLTKAREALRRGDRESARQLGEQAALLVPEIEDVWLVLAASDPNPQDSLAYAQKALELNPESVRARKGLEWAMGRVKQARAYPEPGPTAGNFRDTAQVKRQTVAFIHLPYQVPQKSNPQPVPNSNKQSWVYAAAGFGLLACAVFVFAAWSAATSPVFASILPSRDSVSAPTPAEEDLWAQVDVAKPSITPIDVSAFAPQLADAPAELPTESIPTDVPTLAPTDVPTSIPTEAPPFTPQATETPGTMAMEIIADTPTSQYVAPAEVVQAQYPAKGNGKRWIDVNLSEQRVYAYEGDVIVNSFLVSTGTARTPTVTGKFKIWIKLRSTTMSGPGYYLTNVPYTMYFYKGYGLHGTYWHSNFGTPMSHGCVNLSTPDAEWLYYWALEGTVVNVHY